MFLFLSTFVPVHSTEEDLVLNQNQYLKAFKTWRDNFQFGNEYLFIENSIERITQVVNNELFEICWDLQDFGAVRPFIRIANEDYSSSPDSGSIDLFRNAIKDHSLKNKDYVVIILGKRHSKDYIVKIIKKWVSMGTSNGLYFEDKDANVLDHVVVFRTSLIVEMIDFLINYNERYYFELVELISKRFNFEKYGNYENNNT